MCVCNSENKDYEVIITDKQNFPICTVYFKTISLVARFLDDFDFDRGNCQIYRKKDMQYIDGAWLLDLWKGREYALQD